MSDLAADIRFALRGFRRSPLHALMTVLILGVGIGSVTLMFSAINASVLRPLPYPEPDELVWLWKASDQVSQNSVSYEDFIDYRSGVQAFEDLGATQLFNPRLLLSGEGESERVQANRVTANLFDVLGVSPALGRPFRWEEAVEGGPAVAILSHTFWQAKFGGDPGVLGRTVELDGLPTEVVGVMPQGFSFRSPVELWLPTRAGSGATQGRSNNNFFIVGRLRDGVSLGQAQAQVDAVASGIQTAHPEAERWFHWLQPLHDVFFGDARNTLWILFSVVTLVPLLACTNVASLSLAKATSRNTELATRLALGAPRIRVLRQLMVESLLLAGLGGLLGVALAAGGGALLRTIGPATLPRLQEIGVDGPVLLFGLAASILTVPLFGVLPALRGTRFDLAGALRFGGRGGGDGRGRLRSGMVVAQVALSMTLLVSSGLLLRSFVRLQNTDPGFETESLMTATVQLPDFKYDSPEALRLAWDAVMERIRATPGVDAVAGADWLPVIAGGGPWNALSREDRPLEEGEMGTPGARKFVTDGYFEALGVPILAGRAFSEEDAPGSPPVLVLSQGMAERMFPGEDPLGRRIIFWGSPWEVVGVAADVSEASLGAAGRPAFFVSTNQVPQARLQVVLRARGVEPLGLVNGLREDLRQADPDITLSSLQTMEARISNTLTQPRFRTRLVGGFAIVGLLLAAFGLYGVLAFLVARRRHEIGIRIAVGAGAGSVMVLILRHGLSLVGKGAFVGLLGGIGVAFLLQRLLFGVPIVDPLTMLGATALVVCAGLTASVFPAWRAVQVDPLESLRAE